MGVLQFTNLPRSSSLFSLIIPFSLLPETYFKQMWETVIFIFKKYKQPLKNRALSHHHGLHLKEFYGHCDMYDCGHFGSFWPISQRKPKVVAEDHCERVETLHFQPEQMLDGHRRQRKGRLCGTYPTCICTFTQSECFTHKEFMLLVV